MDQDQLLQEVEALRERLSRLGEAGLRINESLEFETVLQGGPGQRLRPDPGPLRAAGALR